MLEVLTTPSGKAVIWVTVFLIISVIGWFVVLRFRDISGDDNPTASELLTNFRELHQEGDISEQEYRTIKTALRPDIERELNVRDDGT
ncbi:MAG TPA: hypothetical protein DCY79_14180 [Planctomycetaceae bacterium]|nr:hypothetical protein [Blastopirellula sp.]HAY80950.1 hypothetical protein [Planctomycetaceae bacterium]